MANMEQVPAVFNEGVFREVLDIAEISNFNKEVYKMYRSSLQQQYDYEHVMDNVKKDAAKKGWEEV